MPSKLDAQIADHVSYGTALTPVVFDTIQSFKSDNKLKSFKKQAIRDSLIIATAELSKQLIHKDRPDHSDNKSFFSEHVSFSASTCSQGLKTSILFTVVTAALRIIAEKHDVLDTGVGASVGCTISYLTR